MRKVLQSLALALLLAVPLGLGAQTSTLTVCSGTANHEYVPFYGYYADADQHNQLIYPADSLTVMDGETILQMVFYIDQSAGNGSNTAADYMGTWTVSLGETTATTLSGLDNTTTLTAVYTGYFDCSTGTLTLEFDTPYSYNGGNLLVDIQHVAAGYNRWYFRGVNATGASYCYNDQRNFLPMVQFTYGTPPTCLRPGGLVAAVTGDTVTFNWTDTLASAWDIVWGPAGFLPDTVSDANITTVYSTTHEVSGLATGTYHAYVRANCGTEYSYWVGPVTFGVGLVYMPISGTTTMHTCGTIIYDDGGPAGQYSSNCNSTLVLLPGTPGNVVKVQGSSYTEGSYDYLTIYGNGGELLWTDDGISALTSFGPFMADSITIVFYSDGIVQYSGFEINVSCEAMPTCARPESFAIDSVGTDFVALSWVDAVGSSWAVAYGPAGFTLGDATTQWVDFSTTSGTVTGLTPGIKYDFYLMSVCGSNEGDTSWTRQVTTYTACADIAILPYTQNFEALETGYSAEFDPCWTKGANYATDYPYVYEDSYGSVPSKILYFYTSGYSYSNGQQWAVLPTISEDVEVNTLELSFTADPFYSGSSYGHNLIVGVIDSNIYVENMHIDTIANINPSTRQDFFVSFAGYEGTGKNIILFHWLDGNYSYGVIGIDNVDLHLMSECDRPDSLQLTDADSTSLSITWWASDNSTDFFVEWRNVDSSDWQSDAVTTNSFVIDNLTPNTVYDVRVRTVCGSDTSMAVVGQFRTACANITTFPYTEGFEGASASCWAVYDYDGYSSDNWLLSTSAANSGAMAFYSSYNGSTTGTNWLVSPGIEIPDDMTNASLSWYISGGAWQSILPHYAVKVSTTSAVDTTAFVTLLEEDRDDYDDNTYSYVFYKRSVNLGQYAGQTIYIAFVRHTRDDNGLFLDDIKIEQIELPEVSIQGTAVPMVGMASTYSASLDAGETAGLTWSWQSARATAGTATMTVVDSATVSMLYPTAGIDTLRLIGANTFGADTAYLVVNPIAIDFAALPYSTGFEPTDDTTWTISNGPNGWFIDSNAHSTGSYALYISSDNGATNNYNNSSNSESFAYKAFNFSQAGQYGISFDWKAVGESCCDYIRLYLVPADDTSMTGGASSFSAPSTWRSLSNNLNSSSSWQNNTTIFDLNAPGVYYVCIRWHNDGSLGTNPAGAIDNLSIAQITCPAPTNLVFDSIASSSARFHWTPAGSETSWQVQVGTMAPVVVTDTFYTAGTLDPATNYLVKVRAICGAGDTSFVLSGSFWTECVPFTVPFYVQLSGYNGLNVCWSDVATGGTTPSTTWAMSATYGNDFIYSYASSVSNPTSDYLISPVIQIPAGDTTSLRLVYQVAGVPSTYYTGSVASYQVLVSPTGADSVAAFTDTILTDTLNTNTFFFRRLPLGAYAGQSVRIAFRNTSRSSGQVGIYDVAVRFVNEPLYFVYGSQSVLAGDTNSYTAVYQEGDTATMTLSWTSAMAAAGQATIFNANTDSMQIVYSAGGIDSITFIAANAFGADTVAFNVRVTACNTLTTFPYTEGFEFDNPCWIKVYADGDPSINTMEVTDEMGYNLPGVHGGSSAFRFSSYSNTTDYTQYLISPELGGSNLVLSYWAAVYGTNDHLWMGYSTTTRDTAAFTWRNELVLSDTAWTEVVDTLPAGTKYIAFRYYGDYAYYAYLDDLTIDGAHVCAAPVIDSIVSDETTLTVNFSSEADSVEVIVTAGTFDPSASGTVVTGGSYTATGLTHSTLYTVALRALCSEGSLSDWTVDTASTTVIDCQTPTDVTVQATTYTSATIGWTTTGVETAWGIRAYNTIDTLTYTATTNPYTITGLTSGTTYNVEVRALCGQNSDIEGEWSAAVQVTADVCAPVTGLAVSEVTASSAKATWQAAAGSIGYTVYYGLHNFNDNEATTAEVTATEYTMTGLDAETDYEVYIVNRCTADGIVSHPTAADRLSFTTESATEGIYDVESGTLTLYPNPASTSVTVTVSGMDGEVTVEIVDLNGRTSGKWTVESGKVELDLSGMAQGAYFVRVTGDRQTVVRKLIVR